MSLAQLKLPDFIPVIEKYLLADDKKAFLDALPESRDKTLLRLVTRSDFDAATFALEIDTLGLPYDTSRALRSLQILRQLMNQKSGETASKLLQYVSKQILSLNFDYAEPYIAPTQASADFKQKFPSVLEESEYSLQGYITKNSPYNTNVYSTLTKLGLTLLTDLSQASDQQLQTYLSGVDISTLGFDVLPHLQRYVRLSTIKNANDQTWTSYLCKLTVAQLEALPKYINHALTNKIYWTTRYQKTLGLELQNLSKVPNTQLSAEKLQEKKALLLRIRQWANYTNMLDFYQFGHQMLRQVLSIDILLEKPDIALFLEYVKTPYDVYCNLLDMNHRQSLKDSPSRSGYEQWYSIHGLDTSRWIPERRLFENYLQLHFKSLTNIKEVERFHNLFDKTFIDNLFYKTRLAEGDSYETANTRFSVKEYEKLRDSKELTIHESNPKRFKVGQEIVLRLLVKNIKEFTVHVYEINTERYYLSGASEIDSSIALDFIHPTKKVVHKVEGASNPFRHNLVNLSLKDLIEDKPSIYIIDLKGEGISSRAVIKRGSIVTTQRQTLAGHELRFFYEDGSPISALDIWVNGQKIAVKDKHIFPNGIAAERLNIIASVNGYAERVEAVVLPESYDLKVSFIHHEESFLVGTKAKVLVQARLYSYEAPVSLKALKNSRISVKMLSHQDISSSFDVSNVAWDHKNEFELEIPIQTYLKNLSVIVETEVDTYSGKPLKLSASKDVNFRNAVDDTVLGQAFLTESQNEGYILSVLGRNGQPLPLLVANLNIVSALFKTAIQVTLMTNDKGQIRLGRLPYVKNINVTIDVPFSGSGQITGNWSLNDNKATQYEQKLTLKEGETLDLPVDSGVSLKKDISLVRHFGNTQAITDESGILVLENQRIKAKLDTEGDYILTVRNGCNISTILVQVIKGEVWKSSPDCVYQPLSRQIISFSNNLHSLIGVHDPEVITADKMHRVKLDLNVPSDQVNLESIRVHVIAGTFLYETNPAQDIRGAIVRRSNNQQVWYLSLKSSEYMNNKELGDEECYVIARQGESKIIGNNLEKPRIFLKRTENRDTTFGKEELKQTGNYERKMREAEGGFGAARARMSDMRCYDQRSADLLYRGGIRMSGFTTKNNFLKYSSMVIPNLHGKTLTFEVPDHYQYFTVIVASQSFAIQKRFSLPQIQVPKNDISHKGLIDSKITQGYTMSRQCYKLQKGESLKVKRSSLWAAIGGSNIAAYSKIAGVTLPDWVMGWSSYTADKKSEVYDKEYCHELNTFIKFQDPEFFKSVVHPFLRNKLIKTTVDLCLLESKECVDIMMSGRFGTLNPFEKCLLVHALTQLKETDLARVLSTAMELQQKSKIVSSQTFQSLFDTVLTSKLTEQRSVSNIAAQPFAAQSMNYQNECLFDMDECKDTAYAYGAPPPPAMAFCAMPNMAAPAPRMAMKKMMRADVCEQEADEMLQTRQKYKPASKPVEKTKEYVQTTYAGHKQNDTQHLVPASKFWSELAAHLALNREGVPFLTHQFIHLKSKIEFVLAFAFLPKQDTAEFELSSDSENIIVTAKSPFVLFVKEVRSVEYQKKYGIVINQRFTDPENQFNIEEDGTRISKNVEEFVKGKIYTLETVVTNTSVSELEIQVLLDIPEGSLPIGSHELTRIESDLLGGYTIRSYSRMFYFPSAGTFRLYPANVSKNGVIVAKAECLTPIEVKSEKTIQKLDTLNDILQSGNKSAVLAYLREKNIFDETNFSVYSIMYLFKDKEFYNSACEIFRSRGYSNPAISTFAFLHGDLALAKHHLAVHLSQVQKFLLPLFEYYPLSSNRVHKFMKESKSTILNNEFKDTYEKFLTFQVFGLQNPGEDVINLVFAYYLILQDRIKDAQVVFRRIRDSEHPEFPRLQYDYLACFIDMCTGYPNFVQARRISQKYINHPVISWKTLFGAVHQLLTQHDETIFTEEAVQEHEIKLLNKGSHLSLFLPENTTVQVHFHAINLELFFSQSPFLDVNIFSAVKPFKTVVVHSVKGGEERVNRPDEFADVYVQPVHVSQKSRAQTLSGFLWTNDKVKVKVEENKGSVFVYCDGKPQPGSYVKVYAKGSNGQSRFFKDGYTDIQGRFVYITAELADVEQFAILMLTEAGGVVKYAKKPSTLGSLSG